MSAKQNRLVLVVEDNEHNRRIVASVLTYSGFNVTEACNGKQALEIAQNSPPDVVLMDLSLPVLDGWNATRQLRKIPGLERVPVIALTAHAMAGDRETALEAGCDLYLTKPIKPSKIVEEVERLLNEGS